LDRRLCRLVGLEEPGALRATRAGLCKVDPLVLIEVHAKHPMSMSP